MRALLLALFLAACSTAPTPPPAVPDTAERARLQDMISRTVGVEVTCGKRRGYGSGVILKDGIVATAAHVVNGCIPEVNGTGAIVLAIDNDVDAAILSVAGIKGTTLPSPEPYLGQPVVTIGYPKHRYNGLRALQVTRGYLVAKYGQRWRVSSTVWFGNSGGPVFDESGRLVGLAVSLLCVDIECSAPVESQYFIVPVYDVFELANSPKPSP